MCRPPKPVLHYVYMHNHIQIIHADHTCIKLYVDCPMWAELRFAGIGRRRKGREERVGALEMAEEQCHVFACVRACVRVFVCVLLCA
jgi:hypothetical protein